MSRIRWSVLLAAFALTISPLPASTASAGGAVDRIDLPVGWQPEGVTTDGRFLYVGSLATGAILRADPRTGHTHVLARSATGKPAVGLDYDKRRDVIWVAGGESGEIRVQKASNGKLLRTYRLPAADRFVNDLVVTRRAVYATDSRNAVLGVVPLPGQRSRLPSSRQVSVLTLRGEYEQQPGFNANGIVSSRGWLLLVQTNTGTLFRVNPATGKAKEVNLGGATLANGDGLEIDCSTLYVVRNRDNLVAVVELNRKLTRGELADDEITGDVDVPSTVALVGRHLWVVNARFGGTPDEQAQKDYWLSRLPHVDDD